MAQGSHTVRDWLTDAVRELGLEVATRLGMDWVQGAREGQTSAVRPSQNLAEVLAEIGEEASEEHIAELTAWLAKLSSTQKRQLDVISIENLKKLLKLQTSKRDNILKALPRPLIGRIEESLSTKTPQFTETTKTIQSFGNWGRRKEQYKREEAKTSPFRAFKTWRRRAGPKRQAPARTRQRRARSRLHIRLIVAIVVIISMAIATKLFLF